MYSLTEQFDYSSSSSSNSTALKFVPFRSKYHPNFNQDKTDTSIISPSLLSYQKTMQKANEMVIETRQKVQKMFKSPDIEKMTKKKHPFRRISTILKLSFHFVIRIQIK